MFCKMLFSKKNSQNWEGNNCLSLIIKATGLQFVTFLKKTASQVFSENFAKYLVRFECQKQPFADVLQNWCSLKFRKIERKTSGLEFLFSKVTASNLIWKETPAQLPSCKFYEVSKNTFFIEYLQAAASGIYFK